MDEISLWLDDTRPMPEDYTLHAKTADEAIEALSCGKVVKISLDHDLGEGKTGYDVACWIERKALESQLPPLEWSIHSANPVGQNNMKMALRKADQHWSYYGHDRTKWLYDKIDKLEARLTRKELEAGFYRLALAAVAKDEALECRCGSPPYEDGIMCARCTCISALEAFDRTKEQQHDTPATGN